MKRPAKLYDFPLCDEFEFKVQHSPDPKVPTIKAFDVEAFLNRFYETLVVDLSECAKEPRDAAESQS